MSKIIKLNKKIGYITAIVFLGYMLITIIPSGLSTSFMKIMSSLLSLLMLIHIIMSIYVTIKIKISKHQMIRIISGLVILSLLVLHIILAVKLPGTIATTVCIYTMFLVTLIHIIPLKILARGGK
ncbi:MAG: hypothetical protein LUG60_10380 [Erysipelotrichaceae bacterium]|nr:hypothetical protein [Erysipelotrichaceae bacterium]